MKDASTIRSTDLRGALYEIDALTESLKAAFEAADFEFRNGDLDMAAYGYLSERIKKLVDAFYSGYP